MEKTVIILGLGALGSNLAKTLILSDEDLIVHGLDKDKVEKRNLFTQVYRSRQVGQPKAIAFQMEMSEKLGRPIKGKFKHEELRNQDVMGFSKPDLLIDCFDNWQARIYAQNYAERLHCPILRLGFDFIGDKPVATALWNHKPEDSNMKGKTLDVCDLQEWSYWVRGVSAIFAGEVLNFLKTKKQRDLVIRWNFEFSVI